MSVRQQRCCELSTYLHGQVGQECLVVQAANRSTAFAVILRAAKLVTVDVDNIGRLPKQPRLRAHAPADLGQEQFARLLKGVPVTIRKSFSCVKFAYQSSSSVNRSWSPVISDFLIIQICITPENPWLYSTRQAPFALLDAGFPPRTA